MPRSVPPINGTPGFMRIGISMVDITGDRRALQLRVPAATLVADIETFIVNLALATNADIFEVRVSDVYAATPSASNASAGAVESVFDNIVITMKNTTSGLTQRAYIPAPLTGLLSSGDTVDTDVGTYQNVRDAALTLVGAGYLATTTTFTERQESNVKVPA